MLLRTLKKPLSFPLCRLTSFPSVRPISFHSTPPPFLSPCHYSSSSSSSRVNPSAAGTSAPLPFVSVVNIPETELAHNAFFALHRPLLGLENERSFFGNAGGAGAYYGLEGEGVEDEVDDIAHYFSTLRPYEPPATTVSLIFPHAQVINIDDVVAQFLNAVGAGLVEQEEREEGKEKEEKSGWEDAGHAAEGLHATSVLRKRKLKMNKHKHNKLRKRTKALRKKIGK
ncbi:hypothetical protein BC937DRAFT_88369 [Endogone sp. FLAS-F59071]|nr:hypothetical protein BC937DRAFT_88369 [Endogone sp. FLAS-F59071]|eukprot:RUS22582.1 hypothetical protein BC937DRAFT_88369 [Endogone sp. FLAS-F59071]